MKKSFFVLLLVSNVLQGDFKLGIENFIRDFPQKKIAQGREARIGLIANQASCDQAGGRSVDLLLKQKFNVAVLFATEHGFDGSIGASQEVGNTHDSATNIPIVSLYGKKNSFDRIGLVSHMHMATVDCLVFDMQDAGMRHYTYLDTLLKALQSAVAYNKPLIVCDRPNFLGHRMEGPQGNPRIFKKETVGSLPLRHGMTVGEIARYFNEHVLPKKADLHVMSMSYYERTMDTKDHCKYHLSPNIRSINAVHGYSFLGVLGEVRPFNVGVGSDKAFQCIMLPDDHAFTPEQWHALKVVLAARGIEALHYRYLSEGKKKWYRGLEIAVKDIGQFRSFETLLDVLEFFKKNNVTLTLSSYFDTAVGNARVRLWLEGKRTKDQVIEESKSEVKQFLEKARDNLLYQPLPQITRYTFLQNSFLAA